MKPKNLRAVTLRDAILTNVPAGIDLSARDVLSYVDMSTYQTVKGYMEALATEGIFRKVRQGRGMPTPTPSLYRRTAP